MSYYNEVKITRALILFLLSFLFKKINTTIFLLLSMAYIEFNQNYINIPRMLMSYYNEVNIGVYFIKWYEVKLY
jgi:hypothetical protein